MKRKKQLEDNWQNPLVFKEYDSTRKTFRYATRMIVKNILQKYLKKNASIVEIGSGMGELAYNILSKKSPYTSHLIQTEQSQLVVDAHKKIHPNSNITQATVYRLPFKNNTFDAVIGFSSFDTFADLDSALKEMKRVVKKNGYIIHFLDLVASQDTFFFTEKKLFNTYIPFPYLSSKGSPIGFQMVKKLFFAKKVKELNIFEQAYFKEYAQFPEWENYLLLPWYKQTTRVALSKRIQEIFQPSLQINLNKFFYDRFLAGIKKNVLHIEEFGVIQGITYRSKRYMPKNAKYLLHDIEFPSKFSRNTIQYKKNSGDNIAIVSRIHVAVLQK